MNGLDLDVFCDTNIAIYLLSGDSELAEMLQGKKRTIEIRKRSKIKLPDAIIAASASVCGLPLLTADKQFEKISELNTLLLKR
jgi:predicted nucleic acid-binding protein